MNIVFVRALCACVCPCNCRSDFKHDSSSVSWSYFDLKTKGVRGGRESEKSLK